MFKKIAFIGVILAFVQIATHAYGNAQGIQTICPDWPMCYGQIFINESLLAKLPENVSHTQVWLVFAERYLYVILTLLALVLTSLSVWQKNSRTAAIIVSFLLLFIEVSQGLLVYWTVKWSTMPIVETSNSLLMMMVFWLMFVLCLQNNKVLGKIKSSLMLSGLSGIILLLIQVFLGAWLTANHGGAVCREFPLCAGAWWPESDYYAALNVVNGLHVGYTGDLVPNLQMAANVIHRWSGMAVSGVLLLISAFVGCSGHYSKTVRLAALGLGLGVVVELALGLSITLFAPSIIFSLGHTLLAALLMLPLLTFCNYARHPLRPSEFFDAQPLVLEPESTSEPIVDIRKVDQPITQDSLFARLKTQLQRTRSGLGSLLADLATAGKTVDGDLLEELETRLIMADIGVNVTATLLETLRQRLERQELQNGAVLSSTLKEELLAILKPCDQALVIPEQIRPFVILVVGVNGAGKTTTIGKLAKRLQNQGYSVMLAAGDTFRAAAVEQLQTWGERNNIPVVAQHTGADSASVIFDAVQSAQSKGIDVLIADTAGRLHTKSNLMDELKKVKRIMGKLDQSAPHEVLLVLDAGTGQNALSQAKLFDEAVGLTGLVLTKLDGTAKGGVVFALAKQLPTPIRFIGIGEGIDDLQDFSAEAFVDALFDND